MNPVRNRNLKHKLRADEQRSGKRLTAMLAAGSVLLSGHASALELGELRIDSSLGQPLRASIAYALGPNEQLAAYCIYVRAGNPTTGLPGVGRATASLADGRIVLTGRTALGEPMMNMQVTVDCAYAAHLRRDYLLMLDPAPVTPRRDAEIADSGVANVAGSPRNRIAATPSAATGDGPRHARTARRQAAPIESGRRYRVRPGDTLSGIASRIADRDVGLWPAVDTLFAANPDAFVGGDRDRLRAGAMLIIPDTLRAAQSTPAAAAPDDTVSRTYAGAAGMSSAGESRTGSPDTEAADAAGTNLTTTSAAPPRAEPGPFVEPDIDDRRNTVAGEPAAPRATTPTVAIPDTERAPAAPPVPIDGNRVSADNIRSGGSLSWLMWLGGTGIAIILALLLFGRSIRERIGGALLAEEPRRRRSGFGEDGNDDAIIDDLRDTMSRAELFTLDADLGDGSGFDSNPDMDVAQDFNFASSGEYKRNLDMEFDERTAREPEAQPTDMIAPLALDQSLIVEREVLPGSDDGDEEHTGYDLSMVVDATRQNFDEPDASPRDLQAVEVTSIDTDGAASGSFTLNEATGYQLIEQDYEEELTATQALNREIAEAARELAGNLDADGKTTEMEAHGDQDADTVEVMAEEDPGNATQDSMAQDLENTAQIASKMTEERRAGNDDLSDSGVTVEMPADQNEPTVEMEADAARGKRRRSKAS